MLIAASLTLALLAAMCLAAQRSARTPLGLAAIRARDKRYRHSLQFSATSITDATTVEEEANLADWLAEGGAAHRRFLADAQRRIHQAQAETEAGRQKQQEKEKALKEEKEKHKQQNKEELKMARIPEEPEKCSLSIEESQTETG